MTSAININYATCVKSIKQVLNIDGFKYINYLYDHNKFMKNRKKVRKPVNKN